jgi:hypothetical protein
MKRIMIVLILAIIGLSVINNPRSNTFDDIKNHKHDRLYEFKVYSGGVLIFHEAVYDYFRCDNGDFMLWRTKDNYDKNRGMVIRGDIIANDMEPEPEQAYIVSLQPTPTLTPTPKNEDNTRVILMGTIQATQRKVAK